MVSNADKIKERQAKLDEERKLRKGVTTPLRGTVQNAASRNLQASQSKTPAQQQQLAVTRTSSTRPTASAFKGDANKYLS